MKNIGKIILLALAVVLIALGVKALMDVPGRNAIWEDAVYLDEPVVLPENEGKLVIIHGKPEMTAPAYDEELGLTLNSIRALRYQEEYKLISSEKLNYQYGWVSRGSEGIVGAANLGEFELDEKTLLAFPADGDYEDFDMSELRRKGYEMSSGKTKEGAWTDRWWIIVGGLYYYDAFEYVTDLDTAHLVREMDEDIAREREGAKAYSYKVYTGALYDEVTAAGIQKGNRLVADETLGSVVKDGVLSKEDLLSSDKNGAIGGSVVFILIGTVLLALSLRKPKKKKKKSNAAKSQKA